MTEMIKAIRARREAIKKYSRTNMNLLSRAQKSENHRVRIVFDLHAPEDIDYLLDENKRRSDILRKLCARHLTGINGYEGELCYVCLEVEGLEDGELKLEVVERLKQSAALPREALLTPEQMQERIRELEKKNEGLKKQQRLQGVHGIVLNKRIFKR